VTSRHDDAHEPTRRLAELGIHRLAVPTPFRIGPVNCYLIEDDPLTLVDTGANWGGTLSALEVGLAALGRRLDEIRLIVLTHQHSDHIGLADVIARRSGADVMALDSLVPWLQAYPASAKADDAFAREQMAVHGAPRAAIAVARAQAALLRPWGGGVDGALPLAPGSELRLRDRAFRVLHRPGHSPSDVLLHDADSGVAISGDHVLERFAPNPLLVGPQPGAPPGRRERPLLTLVRSLQESYELPGDLLMAPGHGPPFRGHRRIVEQLMHRWGTRALELRDLLAEHGPTSAFALAERVRGSEVEHNLWVVISEVLGHLDLLDEDGTIDPVETPSGRIHYQLREGVRRRAPRSLELGAAGQTIA
jgi:glyoxylase-like metal-dependent hydrolase (beta-lactamase superfamily II)